VRKVTVQSFPDAFRGAGGESPRSLCSLRGLTCPANPTGVAALHSNQLNVTFFCSTYIDDRIKESYFYVKGV